MDTTLVQARWFVWAEEFPTAAYVHTVFRRKIGLVSSYSRYGTWEASVSI